MAYQKNYSSRYKKDSGENQLRRNVTFGDYVAKKSKPIFKNSHSEVPDYGYSAPQTRTVPSGAKPTSPIQPTPQQTVDELLNRRPGRNSGAQPLRNMQQQEPPVEIISFRNIILTGVLNWFMPVFGALISYAVIAKKSKQQAAQSIVLSAIVSIIRLTVLFAD
jgi:hypothetical protein